jgi:hypothetical protein
MDSPVARPLIGIGLMTVGLSALSVSAQALPAWVPLLWLLVLSFGLGSVIGNWTAVVIAPLTYAIFLAVADALNAGRWARLLPWNWLEGTGEDLTIFLLPLLAVASFFGSRVTFSLPRFRRT